MYKIPQIGMGTFPYKEEIVPAIPEAYRLGYRLFDCADNYDNEEYVGKGFDQLNTEQLNDITVVSKYSQPTKRVIDIFNASNHKLFGNINRSIDIYLMHWPYPYVWKQRWREMEELYYDGKCKAIGVCNFTGKYLEELLDFCRVKPLINQFESHPMFQQEATYNKCKEEKILVMSYSPLARMNNNLFTNPVLLQLSEKHKKNVSQIILRWNLQTDRIPIPASKSAVHLKNNFNIFDFELNSEEITLINDLECGMRIRFNPDTRFTKRERMIFFITNLKLCMRYKMIQK